MHVGVYMLMPCPGYPHVWEVKCESLWRLKQIASGMSWGKGVCRSRGTTEGTTWKDEEGKPKSWSASESFCLCSSMLCLDLYLLYPLLYLYFCILHYIMTIHSMFVSTPMHLHTSPPIFWINKWIFESVRTTVNKNEWMNTDMAMDQWIMGKRIRVNNT